MYRLLKSYADGSIGYVGKRITVYEVREKWSEANGTNLIVEIWRDIYDQG